MLSETQRQELRRILGYPNLANQASVQLGYPGYASPFAQWQPYAWLESRFTTLAPGEEVEIYGQESLLFTNFLVPATVSFVLSTPSAIAVGATLTWNVAGTQVQVVAVSGDTPATMAAKTAAAFVANPTIAALLMTHGNGSTVTATSSVAGYAGNGTAVSVVSSDPSLGVAVAIPVGTPAAASYAFGMTVGGADPPGEKVVLEDQPAPIWGYVPLIRILESDLGNVRQFLFFTSAEEFVPRKDEMAARKALLRHYRRKIAERLNVPLDPDLVGNNSRRRFRAI